ncbi:MAG: hypothetical protein TREMPRED_001201, partial [Tremellales sp. Tagirdzhanova-0007]
MFSFFILFSILGALVDAAPLFMPAFKVRDLLRLDEPLLSSLQQSNEITSRFYSSHDL